MPHPIIQTVRKIVKTVRTIGLTILPAFWYLSASAATDVEKDTVHQRLYTRFLELYQSDRDAEYYDITDQLCKYYREHNEPLLYYKMQLNICLYDTEHNKSIQAMKRANNMLEEMEDEQFDGYSQVYQAMGTIYESRGNYRMARHYYLESIDNLLKEDKGAKMGSYSRLANLLMLRYPVEAKQWNDKYKADALTFPAYLQVYHYINGIISFSVGDRYTFNESFRNYKKVDEQYPELNSYGRMGLEIANTAFDGKYDEALTMLTNDKSGDLNELAKFDMRIIIYKMMKNPDMALLMERQRAEYIDSLTSDMLFTNLNELNVQTGLVKTKAKAAHDNEQMLMVILLLALATIGLLAAWVMHYKRNRQYLNEKNEQLRSALAMAEEGEKMKSEFVRSVSHEIRTPLNAISGFNDILNNSDIELTKDERIDLQDRIRKNVQDITNIVDEMLRIADKESNEFYPKSGRIYCNQFFAALLYEHRKSVSSNIELLYTTKLLNRFQIESNEDGLRKIMEQLIQNSIKFTSKGSITVHCEQSDDMKSVLVSVTDTGCGISEGQRNKVFEGFYKADTFQQGIGLGLAVSKKIAQKLGGDLTLDDTYTGGARFVLKLPI
jgi:signal transduction histidine kinase